MSNDMMKHLDRYAEGTEKDYLVKSRDVYMLPEAVSTAVEYFRDLDSTPITGEQVARYFEAIFTKGVFGADATDYAGLPEFPEWLE